MEKDKFEEGMRESRSNNQKFHWNIAIFSGASLTILLNFVSELSPLSDFISKALLRLSIIFLLISLISSPLVNFFSTRVTSFFTQYEHFLIENKKKAISLHNKAAALTWIRAILIYTSMLCAFTALILLVISINRIYLN